MQEGVLCLHALRLSEAATSRVSELRNTLAPRFFAQVLRDSLDPPPSPTATVSGREWWRWPRLCREPEAWHQPFALKISIHKIR